MNEENKSEYFEHDPVKNVLAVVALLGFIAGTSLLAEKAVLHHQLFKEVSDWWIAFTYIIMGGSTAWAVRK